MIVYLTVQYRQTPVTFPECRSNFIYLNRSSNLKIELLTANPIATTTDILDCILLELRNATVPTTIIMRSTAFIWEDGIIVVLYCTLGFAHTGSGVSCPNRRCNKVYYEGHGSGVFGMYAGNTNGDTQTRGSNNTPQSDYFRLDNTTLSGNVTSIFNGRYNSSDMNMDGNITIIINQYQYKLRSSLIKIKNMKKLLLALVVLMISVISYSQPHFIQASIQKNAIPTKIDIMFKANFPSVEGEFVNYLTFSIAIPDAVAGGVSAVAEGATGSNNFNTIGTMIPIPPYSENGETIYGFLFMATSSLSQNWTTAPFVGVTVTFSSAAAAKVGKIMDLTNTDHNSGGGGANNSTYFAIASSTNGDQTNYGKLFFAIPGISEIGSYPLTGDLNCYMTGRFIANNIDGHKTKGIWHSYDRANPPASYRSIPTGSETFVNNNNDYQVTEEAAITKLEVQAYPNPSQSLFNLKVNTQSKEEVMVRLMDISGKLLKVFKGMPDKIFRTGDDLMTGIYFAELTQGKEKAMVKLIKQQ